jgi:hypothetical protein
VHIMISFAIFVPGIIMPGTKALSITKLDVARQAAAWPLCLRPIKKYYIVPSYFLLSPPKFNC